MASASIPTNTNTNKDKRPARIAIVEEHIRLENGHDLNGVLRTFGDSAGTMTRRGMNTRKAETEFVCFTSS